MNALPCRARCGHCNEVPGRYARHKTCITWNLGTLRVPMATRHTVWPSEQLIPDGTHRLLHCAPRAAMTGSQRCHLMVASRLVKALHFPLMVGMHDAVHIGDGVSAAEDIASINARCIPRITRRGTYWQLTDKVVGQSWLLEVCRNPDSVIEVRCRYAAKIPKSPVVVIQFPFHGKWDAAILQGVAGRIAVSRPPTVLRRSPPPGPAACSAAAADTASDAHPASPLRVASK